MLQRGENEKNAEKLVITYMSGISEKHNIQMDLKPNHSLRQKLSKDRTPNPS